MELLCLGINKYNLILGTYCCVDLKNGFNDLLKI